MSELKVIQERPLALVDVKEMLEKVAKRDGQLNTFSNRGREYLDSFVTLTPKKREELEKKLRSLEVTRLKEEHIAKIIDFLPDSPPELKIVLQAYPLSLSKKDQESITGAVKEFL